MSGPTPYKRGVVASGHPCVSEAAADLLGAGGNAFDAAVGAGFASAVVEPALTSLGGGGFLLARGADGRATLFDFFADTPGRDRPPQDLDPHFLPVTVRFPGSDQIFNTGLGSAAVPGNLAGLLHVHERLGRLPLAEVLSPSVHFAREGIPLNSHQGYFLELLDPIVTLTPEARRLFAPEGARLRAGETLRNPDLAAFLEALPSDRGRDFYQGGLAARIARDMREGQGLVTESDLRAYAVQERKPLQASYRGFRLYTNPPPSFGGTLLGLSLELLEGHPGARAGPDAAERAVALVEVMQEVDRRRQECLGSAPAFGRGTTHVSVCDREGNAASMTTSNGEGSGYVVPGTGIMLNNMLGEDDLHPDGFHASPPGLRVASMMSPSVLVGEGGLRLVAGSGGSKRIRTVLLQLVSLVVDFDMPIRCAVDHPRLHWDGAAAHVEPGLPAELLDALERRWPVRRWDRRDVYFGGVHAVVPNAGAAGDPRRGGAALTVEHRAAAGR